MANLRLLKATSGQLHGIQEGDILFDDLDKTIKIWKDNGGLPYKGIIDTTFNTESANPATSKAIYDFLNTYTYSTQQVRPAHSVLAGNDGGGNF